jgi:hypothetical protein
VGLPEEMKAEDGGEHRGSAQDDLVEMDGVAVGAEVGATLG